MIIKNAVSYLLVKLFPAAASLFSIVAFTRLLAPHEYGMYSLTIIFSTTLSTILLSWIEISTGRHLPACTNIHNENALLSTARSLLVTISIPIFLLILLLRFVNDELGFSVIYFAAAILFLLSAWDNLNLRIMNAKLVPARYGVALFVKSIILITIGTLAAYLGFGAPGILTSVALGLFLSSLTARRYWIGVKWLFLDK